MFSDKYSECQLYTYMYMYMYGEHDKSGDNRSKYLAVGFTPVEIQFDIYIMYMQSFW